ncbi:hypothetical protein GCM10007897_42750 [Sphingobium jiangsuense]|uniref:Uncharacterized protein n=1 Tax=Sphingobium jiangsuense TaxID=870476 RepID=A0A7W6FSD6_9SPHN|nr:hypothetical protein [Sphingobium jiangsuense]MBB3928933.1 hypothetical protein [Sphingobium jiangsuense]GLT02850.1 hypothetical protein GCM10007897_42750 [Sphingobium jiangsuense]
MSAAPTGKRSAITTAALLSAYQRLSAGTADITNGKVSVANVALEAGVSRATAYRCPELLAMFASSPKPARRKAVEVSNQRELREVIERLLNRIIVLEAMLKAKNGEIDKLRSMLPGLANVRSES